ncbi:MAG: hypothetical protein IPK77_14830 [Cellvibrio sp.]|nr:hypothetical protein [Cellvibrio sp.]
MINPFLFPVAMVIFMLYLFVKESYQQEKNISHLKFINQYKFPEGFLLKYSQKNQNLSNSQREMVLDGLRQYFRMCQNSSSSMVTMPSLAVDDAWHEFILFTREYDAFSNNAFGYYLHHTPAEAMKSKEAEIDSIRMAWRLACQDEKIDPINTERLPKIFSIDSNLAIVGGLVYTLHQLKNLAATKSSSGGSCSGGGSGSCSGGGSSGSDGGCGGGGCGGGCGGGG